MSRFIYPKEMEPVVKELMEKYNNEDLAVVLNERFNLNMDRNKVRQYLSNRGWSRKNKIKYTFPERCVFTKEQQAFIKANYIGNGPKTMVKMLNDEFNTNFTVIQVKGYCRTRHLNSGKTGRFEKGHIPWCKGMKGQMTDRPRNAGMFKKGDKPIKTYKVGEIKKRNDGYWIKIKEPNVWKQYHRVVYENCFGEIPENTNIDFKDGDKFNINPDNLILVTKKEHMQLNQRKYRSQNGEITELGLNIIKIDNALKEKRKKGNGIHTGHNCKS